MRIKESGVERWPRCWVYTAPKIEWQLVNLSSFHEPGLVYNGDAVIEDMSFSLRSRKLTACPWFHSLTQVTHAFRVNRENHHNLDGPGSSAGEAQEGAKKQQRDRDYVFFFFWSSGKHRRRRKLESVFLAALSVAKEAEVGGTRSVDPGSPLLRGAEVIWRKGSPLEWCWKWRSKGGE